MSFEDTLRRLGSTSAKALRGILGQYTEGLIDLDTARDLMGIVLETAGLQGETLGAVSYAAHAEVATGEAVNIHAAAATNPATQSRTVTALETILAGNPEQIGMRLERLGFADPIAMAQEAFSNVMRADPRIDGWVRGMEKDACQLCTWWWREGRMWNTDHVMPTHTGCVCTQVPTFKTKKNGSWGNVQGTDSRAGSGRLRGNGFKPKRK